MAACGGRGEGDNVSTDGSPQGSQATVLPVPGGPIGPIGPIGATTTAAESVPSTVPTAAPTATPAGAILTGFTQNSCCPLPFWSADSQTVLFWAEREGEQPGVYGVSASGGAMSRVADRPVGVQRGGAFTSAMDGDTAVLTRTADGRTWRFDTGGEVVLASHDGRRAAWGRETRRAIPGQRPPPLRHFVADLETGETREVTAPALYAFVDWTADGRWLMSFTDRPPEKPALIRFGPDDGATLPLFQGKRLRTLRPSRDGRWVAVTRTAEEDPAANGLYVVATDGSVEPRAVPLFGGYRWRDGERLLVVTQEPAVAPATAAPKNFRVPLAPEVPHDPGPVNMRLVEVDAATGLSIDLTQQIHYPNLRIAAGEWSVAPDGTRIAFQSLPDHTIGVMRLP